MCSRGGRGEALWLDPDTEVAMAQELGHHTHHKRHRFEKIEGAADFLTLAFIIALGIAMVVGLVTASGRVSW